MYGLKPVPFTGLGFWGIPPQAQKQERAIQGVPRWGTTLYVTPNPCAA